MKKLIIIIALLIIPAVASAWWGVWRQPVATDSVSSAFTHVETFGTHDLPGANTIPMTNEFNVAVGDTLVAWVGWEDTSATITVLDDNNGDNEFTCATPTAYGGNYGAFCYLLEADTANTTATFEVGLSASCGYRSLHIFQYRPGATGSPALDGSTVSATGTSGPIESGEITTSDSYGIIFVGVKDYSGGTASDGLVDDNAATSGYYSSASGGAEAWAYLFSSQMSAVTGTVTDSSVGNHIVQIKAIKSE
jgi:hypothetical protein